MITKNVKPHHFSFMFVQFHITNPSFCRFSYNALFSAYGANIIFAVLSVNACFALLSCNSIFSILSVVSHAFGPCLMILTSFSSNKHVPNQAFRIALNRILVCRSWAWTHLWPLDVFRIHSKSVSRTIYSILIPSCRKKWELYVHQT